MFLVSSRYQAIIFYKALIHLRSEASRTYLSFLWWALEPIISMSVYYLVFGVLFQRGTDDFVPFLLTGLVVWQWFGNTVSHCGNAINNNLALISQVNFPKIILPSIVILIDAIKFLIVFLLLVVFLWWYGYPPTRCYVALPLVIIAQHLLNTAVANFAAALVPFVPDVQIIIGHFLRIVMYLSGVLYAVDHLPEAVRGYFVWNPMVAIIDAYRDILMYQQFPEAGPLAFCALCSMLAIVASTLLMRRMDPIYARVLLQK